MFWNLLQKNNVFCQVLRRSKRICFALFAFFLGFKLRLGNHVVQDKHNQNVVSWGHFIAFFNAKVLKNYFSWKEISIVFINFKFICSQDIVSCVIQSRKVSCECYAVWMSWCFLLSFYFLKFYIDLQRESIWTDIQRNRYLIYYQQTNQNIFNVTV